MLGKKQGRVGSYDTFIVPVSNIAQSPTEGTQICIQLNGDYIPYLTGALFRLTELDAFEGTLEDRQTSVKNIWLLIDLLTQFLECPTMECCPPTNLEIGDFINEHSPTIAEIINAWNGTTESVAPDMIYDMTGDDVYRNRALCLGLRLFVDYVCDMLVQRANAVETFNDSYLNWTAFGSGSGAAVLGTLVGLGLFTVTGPWLGVSLLLSSIASSFIANLDLTDESPFLDEDAKLEVQCCLYNALKDGNLSLTNFAAALHECVFTPGSLAETLAENLVVFTDNPQNLNLYVVLLSNVNSLFPAFPTILDLPCPCETWEHSWFSSNDVPDGIFAQFPGIAGEHDAINNWAVGTEVVISGIRDASDLWFQIAPPTSYPITRIRAEIEVNNPNGDGSDQVYRVSYAPSGGSEVELDTVVVSTNFTTPNTYNVDVEDLDLIDAIIVFRVTSSFLDGNFGAAVCRIKSITLDGRGEDPFL